MPKPTPIEVKEEARALLSSGVGVNEVARRLGMSSAGVSGLKKQFEKDKSFEQLRAKKQKEFIDRAWEAASKGMDLINRRIDQIASSDEKVAATDMREISTAVGTMIDKARLASGEATQIVDGQIGIVRFEDL